MASLDTAGLKDLQLGCCREPSKHSSDSVLLCFGRAWTGATGIELRSISDRLVQVGLFTEVCPEAPAEPASKALAHSEVELPTARRVTLAPRLDPPSPSPTCACWQALEAARGMHVSCWPSKAMSLPAQLVSFPPYRLHLPNCFPSTATPLPTQYLYTPMQRFITHTQHHMP